MPELANLNHRTRFHKKDFPADCDGILCENHVQWHCMITMSVGDIMAINPPDASQVGYSHDALVEACRILAKRIEKHDEEWRKKMEPYRDIARQKYGCRSDDGERAKEYRQSSKKNNADDSFNTFEHGGLI